MNGGLCTRMIRYITNSFMLTILPMHWFHGKTRQILKWHLSLWDLVELISIWKWSHSLESWLNQCRIICKWLVSESTFLCLPQPFFTFEEQHVASSWTHLFYFDANRWLCYKKCTFNPIEFSYTTSIVAIMDLCSDEGLQFRRIRQERLCSTALRLNSDPIWSYVATAVQSINRSYGALMFWVFYL